MSFMRGKRFAIKKRRESTSIVWHFVYGFSAILTVVIIGYATWYVTRLPFFTISSIEVEGGETISHDAVRTVVEKELEGHYVLLIPKRFTLTYPHDRIVEALSAVPRLHTPVVETEDRTKLMVSFDEYLPHALWCESVSSESTCMFISDAGFAFTEAPRLKGGAFIRHITEGRAPEARAQFSSREELVRVDRLSSALLSELGLRVHSIVYTSVGDEEYHLSGGGKLLVSPKEDPQTTFDNLRSILESAEFKHLVSDDFNYIDLRFGNRIFVKEFEDVEVETATSTEETSLP